MSLEHYNAYALFNENERTTYSDPPVMLEDVMSEDKAFSNYMNPTIMRVLINSYEMNKSKGLSDNELYGLLVGKWESSIGIGLERLLPQTEMKKDGCGCCGRAAAAEIKKEVCCGGGRGAEKVIMKDESCSGGRNEMEKDGGGSCCGGGDSKIEKRGCCCYNIETENKREKCSCECGSPKRIFMVDDSLVSCKVTKKVLESYGHSITLCTNGSEAMNILTKASLSWANNDGLPFDMLFLDIVMPGTDGIEILGHIKSMPHLVNIPVVVLSGLEDEKLAKKCLQMGALAVVQKPLKCHHVEKVLSSLQPCNRNRNVDVDAVIPPPINLHPKSPSSLDLPMNLEVGSIAPIHSIMVCNPKGQMVPAIHKSSASVILLLPRCSSMSKSMNDLVYMVLNVARVQGRVGGAVSLIFITREENVVLPGEIHTYSFVSRVTVDADTWKAFLGVTHTFSCGLLVVDGKGAVVLSWSGLVDDYGDLCEIENCVSKDELMTVVHRSARRTILGTSGARQTKSMSSIYDSSLDSTSMSTSTMDGHECYSFQRGRWTSTDIPATRLVNTFHILVVDDSLMSCKLCVRKLQSLGFSAEYVKSGKSAIETLGKRPNDFNLVLLDIVMPVVDGFEVLSQIKSDSVLCNIPVIMLSGLGEDQLLSRHCLDSGAKMVLCKPLVDDEVEEIVNKILTPQPRSP